MKKKQLARYYSGSRSVKFWDLVNKQKDKCEGVDLYLLGCCLQDMEHRILQLIESAESNAYKKPRKPKPTKAASNGKSL